MKMSINEVIDYVKKANGMNYTMELNDKLVNFLRTLPRDPSKDSYGSFKLIDYNSRTYYEVQIKGTGDFKMIVEVTDGSKLEESDKRVKTNEEAMKLLKELREIQTPYEIDQYWQMSDDHRYVNSMYEYERECSNSKYRIIEKLQ